MRACEVLRAIVCVAWPKVGSAMLDATKAYELEPLLKMIEDYVEFPALVADVTPYAAQLVSGSRLAEISGEIWNYLNNNLQGEALQAFNNVPRMEGLEAWRKMVKMVQGSNDLRRMESKRKIQNPRRAQSLHDFRKAIEEWDTNMRHFVEAGGSNPSYEDKRQTLLEILPNEVQGEVFMRMPQLSQPWDRYMLHGQENMYRNIRNDLIKMMEMKVQFDAQQSNRRGGGLNILPQEDWPQGGAEDHEGEEGEAQDQEDPMSWLFATVRRWKGKGKGKTGGGPGAKGGGKGKGKTKCINCGGAGHRAAECKKPRVEASQRPCFTCGKKGHTAAQCPEKEDKQANHVGQEQASYALSLTYNEPISLHNKFEGLEVSEGEHSIPEADPEWIEARSRRSKVTRARPQRSSILMGTPAVAHLCSGWACSCDDAGSKSGNAHTQA